MSTLRDVAQAVVDAIKRPPADQLLPAMTIEQWAAVDALDEALLAAPAPALDAPDSLPSWLMKVCADPDCGKQHYHVEEQRR